MDWDSKHRKGGFLVAQLLILFTLAVAISPTLGWKLGPSPPSPAKASSEPRFVHLFTCMHARFLSPPAHALRRFSQFLVAAPLKASRATMRFCLNRQVYARARSGQHRQRVEEDRNHQSCSEKEVNEKRLRISC